MIADQEHFDWSRPETWPWIVYLWLGFAIIAALPQLWRWLRRRRAAEWPIANGTITSAVVSKPGFAIFSKRVPYRGELSYSFTCAGEHYAGKYSRDFYSENEAESFIHGLEGQSVPIHHNPSRPSNSLFLDPDLEMLLLNRPAITTLPRADEIELFPAWSQPLLWFFAILSCLGLALSLWVHIGALLGKRVAPSAFFWGLHVGIFVVWIPSILVAKKLVGGLNRQDFWKIVLKGSPTWVRYFIYLFLGYAVVNFIIFMTNAPSGGGGPDPPAVVWRGFSGHWMAFYSASLAILLNAINARGQNPRDIPGIVE